MDEPLPAVAYPWKRAGESLYIGQTMDGISRPTTLSHPVLRNFSDGDVLELSLAGHHAGRKEVFDAEQAMIAQYRPTLNSFPGRLPAIEHTAGPGGGVVTAAAVLEQPQEVTDTPRPSGFGTHLKFQRKSRSRSTISLPKATSGAPSC